jgi:formate dehydrogenase subunit gamma
MQDYLNLQPTVLQILDEHRTMPGNLLPILHKIQDTLGYIPSEAVADIASDLHLSKAEVHGVITFYHYFRLTPPGKHTVRICRAESCQSMNSRALEAHAKQLLAIDYHETTADGLFSLEPVYCMGNCACSPSISIDDEVHGRVTTEKFDALIACKRNS